jgi:integrase
LTDDELVARAWAIVQQRAAGATAPALTLRQLYTHYEAARRLTPGWPVVGGVLRALCNDIYAAGAPPLGDRDVMSLRLLDWSDYRAWKLADEWAVGRRRSEWTVDLFLVRLKALLRWAVDEGRIPHNPLERARTRSKSRREVAPAEDEIGAQLGQADARMRYVVLASADAGMRRNEIRLCEHGWVDARARRIHLAAEACKGKKARSVPATKRLLAAIAAIPRHLRAPWVLTNPNTEQPYHEDSFSRWFRSVADAAGQLGTRLHDNRHGAATNAVERGAKLTAVQQMLGHAHLATTFTYVNARPDDMGAALEAIEAGIAQESGKSTR